MKRITIIGTGYVGISLVALLAQRNKIVAFDINKERIDLINNNESTVKDNDVQGYLKKYSENIKATCDLDHAFDNLDLLIIATPTDYDENKKYFDTSSVENVLEEALKRDYKGPIIIKSTIPVGFTSKMNSMYQNNIMFSPEFLREGNALEDNLYPSRIILSSDCEDAVMASSLLNDATINKNTPILFMSPEEAESVKLFANSFLAMRVSFFNELDSYAIFNNLNSKNIINGICLDNRIGNFYNNPSFGYGGYCLPKDTKQLHANFKKVPQSLISSIIESNTLRKDFITNEIVKLNPKIVGIYRLSMKEGSDNFRYSAILDVMNNLKSKGIEIFIYEPIVKSKNFNSIPVMTDLNNFKTSCDLIICNRLSESLKDVKDKIFTRDIFNTD